MVADITFGPSSVSASPPRDVFSLPPFVELFGSSPFETIDGQRFLVLVPIAAPNRPLKLINNWPARLKR